MKIISVDKLKLGDVLVKPIITPQGKVLLNSGSTINGLYLSKLSNMSIKNVYIEDNTYRDVESFDLISVNTKVLLYKTLENIFEAMSKNIDFNDNAICEVVRFVCEDLQGCDFHSSDLSVEVLSGSRIIEHSINVCILSYIIGNSMGTYNYSKLYNLSLGAILHDIGRVSMSSEDKEHVDKAFNVLRKHDNISLNSSIVSYEHHENIDGSGYPRGVKENNIKEFSRITAVADTFEILLNTSNNKIKPFMIVEEMLKQAGTKLDKELVDVLLKNIVLYPNGVSVKLDNGQTGVVIKQSKNMILKPIVRFEIANQLIDIDLSKDKNINIVSIVNYK